MGRGGRQSSSGTQGADPVRETARLNDSLDLHEYAAHGVASEVISTFAPDSRYSASDLQSALETVEAIEKLSRNRGTRHSIYEADLPQRDLVSAEALFTELADDVRGSNDVIAERLDPEGTWDMDDSDHLYALAAFMRAIRMGRPVTGQGTGLEDSRRDKYADMADQARAIGKESVAAGSVASEKEMSPEQEAALVDWLEEVSQPREYPDGN